MPAKSTKILVEGPKKVQPQAFMMVRGKDETGVSGTGMIAEGCVFSNGKCAVCWASATPCVQVWDSFEAFKAVHIDSHPGNETKLVWLNKERD
jgi:hypothetical protein